jgi:hypothetical protein
MMFFISVPTGGDKLENSLSSMYSKWKNPVFDRPPVVRSKFVLLV